MNPVYVNSVMMWLQFARVKAMEMEHSVPVAGTCQADESAAKKPRQDAPDVGLFQNSFSWR